MSIPFHSLRFLRDRLNADRVLVSRIFFGLLAIIFASSLGYFIGYLPGGHDTEFHLGRIAAIAQGLKDGFLPVRIQSGWNNDFGYPLGVFYGDILLYPAALLHLSGLALWKCYRAYAIGMNVLTALISYYAFRRISGDPYIGLFGCGLYTLSLWRIVDLYVRAALGEYSALAFLPLIAAGTWLLLREDADAADRGARIREASACLIAGFLGLLLTHLLSLVMTGLFFGLFCLFFPRRIFRRANLPGLCFSAVATLLAGAGFLVPFLDYTLRYDLNVKHHYVGIQSHGAYPMQIFSTYGDPEGRSWITEALQGEMLMSVGPVMLAILFLAAYFLSIYRTERYRKAMAALTLLSLLALFMSTRYFPYDLIFQRMPRLNQIIGSVQFPWRYLGTATLLLCCLAVILLMDMKGRQRGQMALIVAAALSVLSAYPSINYISIHNHAVSQMIAHRTMEDVKPALMGLDVLYLPRGTDISIFWDQEIHASDDEISAEPVLRVPPRMTMMAENRSEEDGYLDLPLLYYQGYTAECDDGPLAVGFGHYDRLRVDIPAGYDGEIRVSFREPWHWRAAEAVSVLTLLALLALALLRRPRSSHSGSPSRNISGPH